MFIPKISDLNIAENWEYLPAGAITPKMGLALTQTEGKLAVAADTVKPTYICMREQDTPCADGAIIPVIRVRDDIIFETEAQAEMTAVKLGDKVTLHTDGLHVTATTASGVAEVVDMDGTAVGSKIRVRFS